MHIVHVIEPMEHGVFVWVVDMANRLVNDGYQVSVLHSIRENTPKNWREKFDPKVALHHVQMSRSIDPVMDTKALIKLTKYIKSLNPDVIHTHSSKGGFLARVAGFILGKNKQLLYTSHAIHYPLIENPVKRKLYKYFEHIGYWLGGKIVACGKEEFEIIKKDITHGNTDRLLRISNGIDIEQLTAKDYSVKNKKVKVGVLGRISLQKDPKVFARIAHRINQKRNDIEFIWIGGGEKEDVDLLESAGVSVTGMLDRSEALELLPTLDIYFQTSAYEGLSLALLEAQASGVPAVVTKIPGNDEVVQHKDTGFVAATEFELEKYLEELIDSEKLRIEMGEKAKNYTEEFFSLSAMADQYKTEYAKLVEEVPFIKQSA
ncbi:MAG: glycosyltransferase [Cocleimonas sp.]